MSCKECNAQFGLFKKSRPCGVCKKAFCKQCTRGFLLLNNPNVEVGVVVDPNDPVPVCKACFKKESSVDHSRVYDAYGPIGGEGLVFVHGNMATRRMFCSLVREVLAIRPNSRIFCIDMPGHGSRMGEELTMKSAVAAVKEAVDRISQEFVEFHVADGEAENSELLEQARPAVMGYSMGSYISMACMGSCSAWKVVPRAFMIGGGGFNMNRTGAGLGLSLFGLFTIKLKGELAVAKSVQDQFPKTPVPLIQECFYRAGGHPDIWPKSQAMLLSCNYAEALGRYEGPSLFFRGSTDLSDADELWIQSAKNGKLAVIEGGDHMVFVEYGKETAAVMDKFLSSLSPEDSADNVDGPKSAVKDEETTQEQTEAVSPQEEAAEQQEEAPEQEEVTEPQEKAAEPQVAADASQPVEREL